MYIGRHNNILFLFLILALALVLRVYIFNSRPSLGPPFPVLHLLHRRSAMTFWLTTGIGARRV
jgi:hypothetical protein